MITTTSPFPTDSEMSFGTMTGSEISDGITIFAISRKNASPRARGEKTGLCFFPFLI